MAQPVKLSDDLVRDARLTAEDAQRSIAGQIEFWAQLGRAIEPLLGGDQALALLRRGKVRPLSELIASIDSPEGTARVEATLALRPYPHYEASGGKGDEVVRIDEDGTRTVGRFVNRRFVPSC